MQLGNFTDKKKKLKPSKTSPDLLLLPDKEEEPEQNLDFNKRQELKKHRNIIKRKRERQKTVAVRLL